MSTKGLLNIALFLLAVALIVVVMGRRSDASSEAENRGKTTESERQTVVLAIEGRTNREIAESMFVSVRTVEANLSRAYVKLGVGSRRELRVDLLPPAPQEP